MILQSEFSINSSMWNCSDLNKTSIKNMVQVSALFVRTYWQTIVLIISWRLEVKQARGGGEPRQIQQRRQLLGSRPWRFLARASPAKARRRCVKGPNYTAFTQDSNTSLTFARVMELLTQCLTMWPNKYGFHSFYFCDNTHYWFL